MVEAVLLPVKRSILFPRPFKPVSNIKEWKTQYGLLLDSLQVKIQECYIALRMKEEADKYGISLLPVHNLEKKLYSDIKEFVNSKAYIEEDRRAACPSNQEMVRSEYGRDLTPSYVAGMSRLEVDKVKFYIMLVVLM